MLSLAALTTATALSIDMSLPAMPAIARAFDATTGAAQLALSVLLLGYAAGQLVVRAVSDAIGRRRALAWGLAAFVVLGVASRTRRGWGPATLVAPVAAFVAAAGLGFPNATALALEPARDMAGVALADQRARRAQMHAAAS